MLSEEPIRTGEEIFYSQGSVSFHYKLKSDLSNFDPILLDNALIDVIISQERESLSKEHMQVLNVCCLNPQNIDQVNLHESWFKVF